MMGHDGEQDWEVNDGHDDDDFVHSHIHRKVPMELDLLNLLQV
jgi:hypothetical protein